MPKKRVTCKGQSSKDSLKTFSKSWTELNAWSLKKVRSRKCSLSASKPSLPLPKARRLLIRKYIGSQMLSSHPFIRYRHRRLRCRTRLHLRLFNVYTKSKQSTTSWRLGMPTWRTRTTKERNSFKGHWMIWLRKRSKSRKNSQGMETRTECWEKSATNSKVKQSRCSRLSKNKTMS